MSEQNAHDRYEDLILRQATGDSLSERERDELDAHLADCAICRRSVADWQAIAEATRHHAAESATTLPPLPHLHRHAANGHHNHRNRIEQETESMTVTTLPRNRGWHQTRPTTGGRQWLYAAALVAAIAGAMLVFSFNNQPDPQPAMLAATTEETEEPVPVITATPLPPTVPPPAVRGVDYDPFSGDAADSLLALDDPTPYDILRLDERLSIFLQLVEADAETLALLQSDTPVIVNAPMDGTGIRGRLDNRQIQQALENPNVLRNLLDDFIFSPGTLRYADFGSSAALLNGSYYLPSGAVVNVVACGYAGVTALCGDAQRTLESDEMSAGEDAAIGPMTLSVMVDRESFDGAELRVNDRIDLLVGERVIAEGVTLASVGRVIRDGGGLDDTRYQLQIVVLAREATRFAEWIANDTVFNVAPGTES